MQSEKFRAKREMLAQMYQRREARLLSYSQAVSSSINPLMYLISPEIFMISPNTLALLKEIPGL
jgi:hypothetical protein